MKTKIILLAGIILIFVGGYSDGARADEVSIGTFEKYLKAMKITYEKKGDDRLLFKTGFGDGKEFSFLCVVDYKRKYVHLAVLDLLKVPKEAENLCTKLKTIARLNHGFLMTKVEWHEKDGEVRVSATFFGEDKISAKRFSAAVTSLLLAAEQVEKELK